MLIKNKITSIAAAVTFFILLTSATGWAQKAKLTVGGNGIVKDTVKAAFYLKGGQPFLGTQWSNSGSNIFFNTGNVGIGTGTTTPTQKLEVAGTIYSNTGGFKFPDGTIQTSAGTQQNTSATFSALQVSNLTGVGDRMVAVDASGNLKIGASLESWDRSGNILTGALPTTPAEWFGSNNLYDVILKTNNVERMRISSTGDHPGNVGIGTDSPEKKLHVLTTHLTCALCEPETHEGIRLEEHTTYTDLPPSFNITSIWDIQPYGSGFAIKRPNENPKIFITPAGDVGIGTTNPYKKLTVNGDVSLANYNTSGGGNQSNGFSGFEILGMGQVPTRRGISLDPDPNGSFNLYINSNQGSSAFNFKNGSVNPAATLMTIDGITGCVVINDTHVPIDNTNPIPYKLAVNGRVLAQEYVVRLRNDWPDYVFKKGYALKSLNELEAFVKENNHLPGIPSAKEVEKSGVSLGDMVTKQMEKIEEISLYLIELNKKVDALQAENTQLKASIKK